MEKALKMKTVLLLLRLVYNTDSRVTPSVLKGLNCRVFSALIA